MVFRDQILKALGVKDGLTDRELTDRLRSKSDHPSHANQECRRLAAAGILKRATDLVSGVIRNWLSGENFPTAAAQPARRVVSQDNMLSEDEVKHALKEWLEANGWTVEIAWGKQRGVDVTANRGIDRWLIEAKGCGSRSEMRKNYFIAMLGELLERMSDPDARYSIALPDMPRYRGLWERLPALAKSRTTITALFVDSDGSVCLEQA